VQGQDYYYTLQGWLKGVNMPYRNDPGGDGGDNSMVAKDVTAFTLGYFKGDYVSINRGVMDSTVLASDTDFRYGAMGNRVEKKVVKGDTVTITRYLRDASGNVMSVYNDTTMIEQPIYGSTRVGMYIGGSENGKSILGLRRYELTNHLGNVLSVISDKINMHGDTITATVLSTSDYYPFGLAMEGRTWSDTTVRYRYGFNGKERDDASEWGSTEYDYGFRIYNPAIGKFLSVDPLSDKYLMLTPYQYASNNPILNIDVDGLEGTPATLFHNTEAGKEIFTNGFDATTCGKYSSYNWFGTTSDAPGTGRTGVGVTMRVEGLDVSQAHTITTSQFNSWEAEAMNEMRYVDRKAFNAARKTLSEEKFSELHKEMRGRTYGKMGKYMDAMNKSAYYFEKEGTYALSDTLA
jgi:RHS repeat-associated protein